MTDERWPLDFNRMAVAIITFLNPQHGAVERETVANIAGRLVQVWNARGAADRAICEADDARHLAEQLRALDAVDRSPSRINPRRSTRDATRSAHRMPLMTTDETIAAIQAVLDTHAPGTWANGQRLAAYLRAQAEKIEDEVADDMSARHE